MDLVVVLSLFLCLGRVLDGSTNVDQRSRGAREGWPHVRPKRETNSVKGSFHVSPGHVYLQTNQNHSIPCLSWAGEELLFTFWNKGDLELARSVPADVGEDYILNDRYGISDDHALVVKNVQKDDQGVYICKVVFKTGHQKANSITVTVLDTLFPATNGDLVANASLFLERRQRHELSCPILAMEPAAGSYTIYWSEDIGDTNFTRIIGARYSDGETKVMDNYNGDYDVKEGDLVAKSFNKLSTRLWCHLFREGPSWMLSGFIEVTGKVTSEERCPSISQCDSCEECTVKVEDKHLRLNCSVKNIYPELDELSWSVIECDTPVSISTESYLMHNKTTETFIQKEELRINLPTDASINCTLTCVASGLPITNSPFAASVFVTGGLVPPETTDVYILPIIIPVVVSVIIFVIMVLVRVCLIPILRKHGCVICQEQGRPVDGDAETNVEENPMCKTAVHEENVPLVVQNPSASASTQLDPPPDYTEDSVNQKAGSSSNEPCQVREDHNHYTVYYLFHTGGKYARRVRNAMSPGKRGDTTKQANLQRRDQKDHVPQKVVQKRAKKRTTKPNVTSAAAATPRPGDCTKDDDANKTQFKQSDLQQRKATTSLSVGHEHCVVIEMEGNNSVKSDEIKAVDVPLPNENPEDWGDDEPKPPDELPGKQRQNSRDNGPKGDELSTNETVAEGKTDTEVPEPELQKEDDYITKTDDMKDTSISHLETQQLLEPANNLKKEAKEVERVSSASDEEESEPLLKEVGSDEILPSQDISDEQVQDTDQSEKLLLQATLSDVNNNEEGTTQEEVSSTVQTTSEMTDTECKSPVETSVPPLDESEQDERFNFKTSHKVLADADANRSFTSTPPSGPLYHGTETSISTTQSPTIDQSDPVTPDESHGSPGEDLTVTTAPKPTPPCERPSLDSAEGHSQPSLENSHADPSPHQSPSAAENPLRSDDEEMGSDDSDDITDNVINENQKANPMEVAGYETLNESPEPHVQDTPATNYDQERGNPRKEKTKKKKGSNKPYSRPERSTASAQQDKKAAAVQDRSEQCEQDMEANADEVGSKSKDAPAEVAMDSSDEDARPLLKEKETGIRESQRMKELKAANPLKKENILKERDAHRSKPPPSVQL